MVKSTNYCNYANSNLSYFAHFNVLRFDFIKNILTHSPVYTLSVDMMENNYIQLFFIVFISKYGQVYDVLATYVVIIV